MTWEAILFKEPIPTCLVELVFSPPKIKIYHLSTLRCRSLLINYGLTSRYLFTSLSIFIRKRETYRDVTRWWLSVSQSLSRFLSRAITAPPRLLLMLIDSSTKLPGDYRSMESMSFDACKYNGEKCEFEMFLL